MSSEKRTSSKFERLYDQLCAAGSEEKKGKTLELARNVTKRELLEHAVNRSNIKLAEWLLEKGAPLEREDPLFLTALSNKQFEMLALLSLFGGSAEQIFYVAAMEFSSQGKLPRQLSQTLALVANSTSSKITHLEIQSEYSLRLLKTRGHFLRQATRIGSMIFSCFVLFAFFYS